MCVRTQHGIEINKFISCEALHIHLHSIVCLDTPDVSVAKSLRRQGQDAGGLKNLHDLNQYRLG